MDGSASCDSGMLKSNTGYGNIPFISNKFRRGKKKKRRTLSTSNLHNDLTRIRITGS
ncbi:hypothetical protein X975_12703, partial [Stegodyphus mimosarum]